MINTASLLILVFLIESIPVILQLQQPSFAKDISFNPNARRFHSDVPCDKISRQVEQSNGASTAILSVGKNNNYGNNSTNGSSNSNDNKTYNLYISWFVTSGDDGEDFYKGDCRNSLTNLKLKPGQNIKLSFNEPIGEGVRVYLVDNDKSDTFLLTHAESRLIQFEKLGNNTENGGVKDFEFKVPLDNFGIYKLIINENQNDEAQGFIIIRNVKLVV
jgi:hypothetical protein